MQNPGQIPGLGVKWLSSWYVEGTLTTLALSAVEGCTSPRRPAATESGVLADALSTVFRVILENMMFWVVCREVAEIE